MKKQAIIQLCKTWVERFVIGLQLCPFAKKPYDRGQVHFDVCFEKETEEQLMAFWKQIELLTDTPPEKISNTILIYPHGLSDFETYLDFYDLAAQLLVDQNRHAEFQLASFHPNYQFEHTSKDDVSNYTNRSPVPFIHILRVEEVAAAVATYPNVERVPEKNIEKLEQLGIEGVLKLK